MNRKIRSMDEAKLNTVEMKHSRRIVKKTRCDKIRNMDITGIILGCFKSFVPFYESTLNCNISVNTYSI